MNDNNQNKLVSEKWKTYRIPNGNKEVPSNLIGYTIIDDILNEVVGIIIQATNEDIVFYGKPNYWENPKTRKSAKIKSEDYYG